MEVKTQNSRKGHKPNQCPSVWVPSGSSHPTTFLLITSTILKIGK